MDRRLLHFCLFGGKPTTVSPSRKMTSSLIPCAVPAIVKLDKALETLLASDDCLPEIGGNGLFCCCWLCMRPLPLPLPPLPPLLRGSSLPLPLLLLLLLLLSLLFVLTLLPSFGSVCCLAREPRPLPFTMAFVAIGQENVATSQFFVATSHKITGKNGY